MYILRIIQCLALSFHIWGYTFLWSTRFAHQITLVNIILHNFETINVQVEAFDELFCSCYRIIMYVRGGHKSHGHKIHIISSGLTSILFVSRSDRKNENSNHIFPSACSAGVSSLTYEMIKNNVFHINE